MNALYTYIFIKSEHKIPEDKFKLTSEILEDETLISLCVKSNGFSSGLLETILGSASEKS